MADYGPEQLALARKITQIGRRKGASAKEILAAIQTGIVESGLRNLSGGDRDSAGWRQERASLYKDPTNLTASINRFFDETRAVRDKYGKAGDLAAAVQRPAAQYRGRYQQVTGQAKKVLAAVGGAGGGGGGGSSRSGATSITEQPTAGTVATYQPGTNNAALRQQVTANYFQNRGKPGNLLALIGGLQNAQDQPGSLDTRATASTAYTASPGASEPVAAGSKVSQYKAAADLLDAAKLPYKWGGGHGKKLSPLKSRKDVVPVDCSGAVSAVLGINPRVSGQFEAWGKPGKGKKVTIYANEGHVLMEIDGKFFGTSKTNPGGGAGWIPRSKVNKAYLSKFTARHPAGL